MKALERARSSIVWRIKKSQFINHNFKTMPHSADQSKNALFTSWTASSTPGILVVGQCRTMWSIFWESSWQKGHSADSTYPHLWRLCAVLPRPLLILFASVHCCFDVVWKPGSNSHGYRTYSPPQGVICAHSSLQVCSRSKSGLKHIKWISWT